MSIVEVMNGWILPITSLTTALDKYCPSASLTIMYAKCSEGLMISNLYDSMVFCNQIKSYHCSYATLEYTKKVLYWCSNLFSFGGGWVFMFFHGLWSIWKYDNWSFNATRSWYAWKPQFISSTRSLVCLKARCMLA